MDENLDLSLVDDASGLKRAALGYVTEAFAEAELVDLYGEEQTATYAEAFPDRIRGGAFSVAPRH